MTRKLFAYVRVLIGLVVLAKNWPRLLLARVLLPGRAVLIHMRNGLQLISAAGLSGATLSILVEIWYEHGYTPLFFALQPTDVVVDIGANQGFFSVYAAHAATSGRVIAFEPVPALVAALTENITRNGFRHVTVVAAAVAESTGETVLHVSDSNSGGHSLYAGRGSSRAITVPTITLAQYCEQEQLSHIDFLKIDCEGAEYGIVASTPPEFWVRVKRVALEYHVVPGHTPHELVVAFERAGFVVALQSTGEEGYLFAYNRKL